MEQITTGQINELVLERAARRNDLRLRRTQALTHLLVRRQDLRGVNAAADLLDDAVRWSA
jgi:hypothetical protein